jgi:outer membrane protein assembly factor BamD (BamD/ComL family)
MKEYRFLFALLCCLLGPVAVLCAQDAAPAVLFLSSIPINAQVLDNGQPLTQETPMLLRDLPAGRHVFEVRKEEYPTRTVQVVLKPGEVRILNVDLGAGTFQPAFLNEQDLILAGKEEPSAGRIFQLPEGGYRIHRVQGRLQVEPVYPHQGLITGLGVALPLALAFSGVLTMNDLLNPPRGTIPLSAPTLSAYGITIGLAGLDLVLLLQRRRYIRKFSYYNRSIWESEHMARESYERGEQMLALDRREEALRFYGEVVYGYKDSPYLPQALFKTAKIHSLTGEDTLAILELQLIVSRYPLPELYDKARKTLADLYLRQGAFKESLEQLEAMLFADPSYDREEIDLYRCQVLEQWTRKDPARRPELLEAYRRQVERYPQSANAPAYLKKLSELESGAAGEGH